MWAFSALGTLIAIVAMAGLMHHVLFLQDLTGPLVQFFKSYEQFLSILVDPIGKAVKNILFHFGVELELQEYWRHVFAVTVVFWSAIAYELMKRNLKWEAVWIFIIGALTALAAALLLGSLRPMPLHTSQNTADG